VVTRRTGLGKGLGALIPTEREQDRGATFRDLPTSAIDTNPRQPRQVFDEETLVSLTASIREIGVLQPILVRPSAEEGRFELIAGERRLRAAKRAGLAMIPALVRETEDIGSLEQALVENLHRQDLGVLEEAAAYQTLVEEFRLSHDEIAKRVGKSRSTVTNTLRLLQLPPSVLQHLASGRLSAGHARALLGTPDRAFQEALAVRAVRDGLTVRRVEDLVKAHQAEGAGQDEELATQPAQVVAAPLRDAGIVDIEDSLASHLDTRVRVETVKNARGRIVIDFAGQDDLERIYRRVLEGLPTGLGRP